MPVVTSNFHLLDKEASLAVVCHDAGAANLIFPWLKSWSGNLLPFMDGPAVALWKKAFPQHPLCCELSQALESARVLITGTGWASSLEHDARRLAAIRGLYSVAVIDHWVNYHQRFERMGETQLPNEIWVVDQEAEALAKSTFPDIPVNCQENLYLADQLKRIGPPQLGGRVLYVLEPVRNDWGRGKLGELQALDYAIENLSQVVAHDEPVLVLRPHPSELADKYQDYVKRYSFVRMDDSLDLALAIDRANIVIGVESFALTISLQANRPTYSSLPPWAPTIRLPHRGIIQIRDIVDRN